MHSSANGLALVALLGAPLTTPAQVVATGPPEPAPALRVPDAPGPITLDGRLDEPAWAHALWLTTFYETWPRDNVTPTVRTAAALTYDAHFLYLGVRAQDPHPRQIRAGYTERDSIGSADDYVSFVLDTRGEARSAVFFRVSPRGVQADGVFDDAQYALGNPSDLTPDFPWDASVALDDSGWTAEIRIPLATLRYPHRPRQTWGVIVHRRYPRDFVRQLFSVPIPRGSTCFLCHAQRLEFAALPETGGLLIAPYTTARAARTTPGPTGPSTLQGGTDVKWTPTASTALDATLRPDFSQVESDAAQLSVNAAFALFYPEKRRFFLEGADLFQTPLQAVYTRSIAAPEWGARMTGELDRTAYTALVTRDRGGGSVIIPGAAQSSLVSTDFASVAAVARTRTALSHGFLGLLVTDREIDPAGGGGHNRVLGPDLLWNVTRSDQAGVQLLASDTRVPARPDLLASWDARVLRAGALDATWHHLDRRLEWFAQYRDIGDGFRADAGFTPQVGIRLTNVWTDLNFYRPGGINWWSPWIQWQRVTDRSGALVSDYRAAALQLNGPRSLYLQLRLADERLRAGDSVLPRRYAWLYAEANPGRRVARVTLFARGGQDVDLVNARRGMGAELKGTLLLRATDHVELDATADRAWLDVAGRRLFTATIARLRASYMLDPRAGVRVIVQHVRTERDPALYLAATNALDGSVTVSALFTYRWNWATAAYVGIGDDRERDATGGFAPAEQQIFAKLQLAGP